MVELNLSLALGSIPSLSCFRVNIVQWIHLGFRPFPITIKNPVLPLSAKAIPMISVFIKSKLENPCNTTPAPNPSRETRLLEREQKEAILLGGAGVLGDGFCAFRHGVLGKLTRQDESDTIRESVKVHKTGELKRTRSGSLERK